MPGAGEARSKVALPVSSVASELLMVTKGPGFSREISRLGMPRPRESRRKAVRRMISLPSALAVRGEAKRYEFWVKLAAEGEEARELRLVVR